MITTQSWSSRNIAEVMVHIKKFTLTRNNHVFDGNYRIKIIDFLTPFFNEDEML